MRVRPVHVASCPEHGLHGRRNDCHICGGPVDQVAFVAASDHFELREKLSTLLDVIDHLPGVHNPSWPIGAAVKAARDLL